MTGTATTSTDEAALWSDVSPDAARRLLHAGLECFAARGYHATTTRDIARRAGMSPAAVYVHFPSKADLLYRISLTGHEMAWASVQDALVGRTDTIDRLRSVVSSFTAFHGRYHRLARVSQHELRSLHEPHFRTIVEMRHRFAPLVEAELLAGVANGSFVIDDIAGTALAILSLPVDLTRWFDPAGRRSPEHIGELYADLTLRMISARRDESAGAIRNGLDRQSPALS